MFQITVAFAIQDFLSSWNLPKKSVNSSLGFYQQSCIHQIHSRKQKLQLKKEIISKASNKIACWICNPMMRQVDEFQKKKHLTVKYN